MRRLVHGVVVVSILVSLSVPAQARAFDDDAPLLERGRAQVVKVVKFLKRFVPSTFGDMLTVPRP